MSISISIYLLWQQLGAAALAGLTLMLLLIPLNTVSFYFILFYVITFILKRY